MSRLLLAALLVCGTTLSLTAQEFSYGFRTGLNFNQFNTESEVGPNGEELEELTGNTGFHIGASFSFGFTDLVGLRGELIYSQRGGKRRYNGPGFLTYFDGDERVFIEGGNRDETINVTNSYIDIPVMVYYRPDGFPVEVFGGVYAGATINSIGSGRLLYTGDTGEPTEIILDLNYFRDKPEDTDLDENVELISGGTTFLVPTGVSAYYDREERDGTRYNTLDFGLTGGLSIYLGRSLFISGRLMYGLADTTRDRYDISRQAFDRANNEFVELDRQDQNFTIQASVGFGF